jgi:hypothetical protein
MGRSRSGCGLRRLLGEQAAQGNEIGFLVRQARDGLEPVDLRRDARLRTARSELLTQEALVAVSASEGGRQHRLFVRASDEHGGIVDAAECKARVSGAYDIPLTSKIALERILFAARARRSAASIAC